ncbi:aminotransferase class I/II-fold pyridoxal phosphate-dependent enzyme [bacterium]|nr:aminotransferase class I/II-fold pyridoxal phosphate-dependent enzyme [bacterium]
MPRGVSKRVSEVAPYLFAELDKAETNARARGIDVIRLSIGDPDLPTPPFVVSAMQKYTADPKYHRYPPYGGTDYFLSNVKEYMKRRFGVELEKDHILCLIGAKEGLAHLAMGILDPGDYSILHEPAFPVPASTSRFHGAILHYCPLKPENDYLIDLDAIPSDVLKRARVIWVNYPNNPTGATAPRAFYEELVDFAHRNDIWIVNDLAYGENYFDPAKKPLSILEIDGALDYAIEFHSFSKLFNMTGWRIGWCCGNKTLIDAVASIKNNHDTSQFGAIQDAASEGLLHPDAESWIRANNARMRARRDMVIGALRDAGIEMRAPDATLYIWAPLPEGFTDSIRFAADLLENTGVVIAPGRAYGPSGEGFFRISLTYPESEIEKGMARIAEHLAKR